MKKVVPAAVVAVLAIGLFIWWSLRDEDDPDALVFFGNVNIRQVSLAFDGSGRIVDLAAEEGDRVTSGQTLGRLATETLKLQAQQAEAQVEVQRQALLTLQNGARPEEIAQLEARLASAQAQAKQARDDFERQAKLLTGGSSAISAQSVETAGSQAAVAEANVAQAQAALDLAKAGARDEDIAAAKAQVAAAEANLKLIQHQIDQATLRAPVDAVVRSRLLEPGDQASSAKPVFALAIEQPKWVRVFADEADLGRIAPGMPARVTTDSAPDAPIKGHVGFISSVAEFTPKSVQTEELRTSLVYEVRVVVEDPENALRLGQPVTVQLGPGDAE